MCSKVCVLTATAGKVWGIYGDLRRVPREGERRLEGSGSVWVFFAFEEGGLGLGKRWIEICWEGSLVLFHRQ